MEHIELWIAGMSAAIALLSLLANWTVIQRQVTIQAEAVGATLDGEKARWMAEVLDAFCEASALVQSRVGVLTHAEFTDRQIMIVNRFSALADHGRLFFPNVAADGYGSDKLRAFRGKRRSVLNAVILAHDIVRNLDQSGQIAHAPILGLLFDLRRLIVSEVQHAIDPHHRDQRIDNVRRRQSERREEPRAEVRRLVELTQTTLPGVELSFTDDDIPRKSGDGRG